MDKFTAQKLADIGDDEFDALVSKLRPKLERMIMSPPRKPRREKPATTIRILRRQLSIAQSTIQALQMDRADKEKVIAGYDVQLSEAQEETERWRLTVDGQAKELGRLQSAIRSHARRLAYLEGYHAKSQEILRVPAPSSYVARDQSQTDPGQRAGNQENLSPRRQGSERARENESQAGPRPRPSDPIWR